VARNKLPDPLARRHLVERELPPEKALELAESYLGEGRRLEAVDFLRKAGASDRLVALRAEAIADGDAFLLRRVAEAMASAPTREEWQALAQSAERAGKDRYAGEARRQAERGED
jgi:hypothetical protein